MAAAIDAKRILISAPGWVGDTVMATPFFAAVRKRYPDAHVAVLCKPGLAKILRTEPWFNEVIEDSSRKSVREFLATKQKIRAGNFDLGILLPNSFRSALLLRLSGIGRVAGYARGLRSMLLSLPVPVTCGGSVLDPVFMGEYYARLADALGIPDARTGLALHPGREDEERCAALLHEHGIGADDFLLALNPGAQYGSAKCWEPASFARVGDWCAETMRAKVIVLAGPGEESIAGAIKNAMRTPAVVLSPDRVPLDVLKAVIRRTQLLLTNDTGPRHYAVALGTPVVTLIGPTQPEWSDSGCAHERTIQIPVDCGPCMRRVCPLGHHKCMKDLRPEMAQAAIEELIAQTGASSSMKSGAGLC